MNNQKYVDDSCSKRLEKMNNFIYERNKPSQPLQPYLEARPVMTKYSILPIIDSRVNVKTKLKQEPTFIPNKMYNPGNSLGPWSGFASNINNESELRNQFFAHQNCPQSVYVPSSKSSLYNHKWENEENVQQPFKDLFNEGAFSPVNPNAYPEKVGFALFNNATRQQTKDLTKMSN